MTVRAAELLMGIAMLALSVGIMIKSAELTVGWVPERGPGAGAWPFWLAGGMALASIATIVRWFQGATPESRSRDPYIDSDTVFLVIVTVVALAVAIAATAWIGMYFSVMAFLLFYLKVIGRHGWGITLAVVIGAPVFIFGLFEWALKKYLPKGLSMFEEPFFPLYDVIYSSAPAKVWLAPVAAVWAVLAVVLAARADRTGARGWVAFAVVFVGAPLLVVGINALYLSATGEPLIAL